MRTALYARVSTEDQTCQQQLTALREYATTRGWTVQGEYTDTISGAKDKRPALDKLMAAARKRQIDCVVVWKLDRWGRSIQHLVTSMQELSSLGVRFVAPTQGIDTDQSNPASRLMVHMLAAFAEFERELIRERTKAGMDRARKAGAVFGRPKVIVNRDKVRDLRAAGKSIREIADALDVPKSSIARILQSNA